MVPFQDRRDTRAVFRLTSNTIGKPVIITATHELIREVVEMARSIGRPIATPAVARQIFGISQKLSIHPEGDNGR